MQIIYHQLFKTMANHQRPEIPSFAESHLTTQSNQDPEVPESTVSTSSIKPKQCSLFPCFKNYLKRKFSGSSEKPDSEKCFPSPNNQFGLSEKMTPQTTPSTIATAGVIAAALCDSPEPDEENGEKKTKNYLQSTSSQQHQPTKKWTLRPLVQDPPPPDHSPNLSSFFETFIRANLEPENPLSSSSLAPSSKAPCQVSGLVNKIISTVFTPEQVIKSDSASLSSSNSAICQLLATPPPQEFNTPFTPSTNTDYLNSVRIPDKVYQQLIEFEFNYEPIVQKFAIDSDDFSPSRNALNSLEAARINELTTVLAPLNVCLSSQSPEVSAARENLMHFISGSTGVTDFQRETLFIITKHSFNLLIALAKQLESFASLNSLDQKILLQNSVMEIMLLRSIMVRPLTSNLNEEEQTPPLSPHANYCTSHVPFTDETNENDDNADDDDHLKNDESSIKAILDTDEEQQMAMLYAKQFRDGYRKLASTIDAEWKADRTIFYLVSTLLVLNC